MKINKKTGYVLTVAFVVIIAAFAFLFYRVGQLSDRTDEFTETLITQGNKINQAYTTKHLAYEPSTNMLYLPELRIKIPYNNLSKSLTYSMRQNEKNVEISEADVSSDKFMPSPDITQYDCSNFLRLKIEDRQNPYNPAEKAYSYELSDGRKLQVYVFSGELEGNRECKVLYGTQQIYPQDFIKAFKDVQSY